MSQLRGNAAVAGTGSKPWGGMELSGEAVARGLRVLHTSDWHIGRTFHGHSTLDALRIVLDALVDVVRTRQVDVVAVAGDVFDSSTPSAEAVEMLDDVLLQLTRAGAHVILTSGNHDSPARLGAKGVFAKAAGIHVITKPEQITEPLTLADAHGEVHLYGIPFLEPARMRSIWPDAESMRSQKDAITYAMTSVRTDHLLRGGRAVVLAHTFAQGGESASADSERDIVGGVDKVPLAAFDGVTYAALGHIHGRAELAPHLRYCGAPLHYSFSEADKKRGVWLIDLDAGGLAGVEWVDLPVPRPLTVLTGRLDEILTDPDHEAVRDNWVSAILTDNTRPMDAMRKLQTRFPHCAHLEFQPSVIHDDGGRSYAELVQGKSDPEIIDGFLEKVRNGEGATDAESDLLRDVIGTETATKVLA